MGAEIYANFNLKQNVHLDARLAPVATALDLPDPNNALNFLYEGATVFVKGENVDYQLRKNLLNPSILSWYKTTKGDLVIGEINLLNTATSLDFNQVNPSIDICYAVKINILEGNTALLKSITNFPSNKDITIFCENGKTLTVENINFNAPSSNHIILENGLNMALIGRAGGPDYLTLRKENNVLVQISARQLVDAGDLLNLKIPVPQDGAPGPQGPIGLTGPAGTNGTNGAGYNATTTLTTDILTTSDTEVLNINIGPNKAYTPGARVRVTSATDPLVYFEGITNSYNINSGILDLANINIKKGNILIDGACNVNVAGESGIQEAFDSNEFRVRKFMYGTFPDTEPFMYRGEGVTKHQALVGGTAATGGNRYFTDFGWRNGNPTDYDPIVTRTGTFANTTLNNLAGTFVMPETGYYNVSVVLQIRFAASNTGFTANPVTNALRDGNSALSSSRSSWIDTGKTGIIGVGVNAINDAAQSAALTSAEALITPETRGISIIGTNITQISQNKLLGFTYVNTTDASFWGGPEGSFFVCYFEARFIKLD